MRIKALAVLFLAVVLCFAAVAPVFGADDGYGLLMDEANLLTPDEKADILALLEDISGRHGMDVVVVTVYTIGYRTAMGYADDYFDYHGYGQGSDRSGVLLLHVVQSRDWWILMRGYGETAFTDAGLDYIGMKISEYLAGGQNAAAYLEFAELCDRFITQAETGSPYESGNLPREPLGKNWIIISFVAGLVIALLILFSMCSKHKTVRYKAGANNYIRSGSVNLTESRDIFLYKNVTRVAKPKPKSSGSSTHRGSSGASHGGRGGKY